MKVEVIKMRYDEEDLIVYTIIYKKLAKTLLEDKDTNKEQMNEFLNRYDEVIAQLELYLYALEAEEYSVAYTACKKLEELDIDLDIDTVSRDFNYRYYLSNFDKIDGLEDWFLRDIDNHYKGMPF